MIPTLQAKDSTYDFSLLEDKQGKLKKGSLQMKKQNLEAKQSKAPCICVDEHAYACCSYPNPRLSQPTILRR
ncbi:hypothetical protein PIB30_065103, partial [Stylosanthes scabra]|nr:hypothetical protein [Stylosanthes scabra]